MNGHIFLQIIRIKIMSLYIFTKTKWIGEIKCQSIIFSEDKFSSYFLSLNTISIANPAANNKVLDSGSCSTVSLIEMM